MEAESFLAQNPEMQSASKVPLSQFVKALHKDVEMPSQNLGEKFEANDVADEEKTDEADENESATPVEHLAGTKTGTDGQSLKKKKWKQNSNHFLDRSFFETSHLLILVVRSGRTFRLLSG